MENAPWWVWVLSAAACVGVLGAYFYSWRRIYHKGTIDDARIYNRVLSAGEIKEIHDPKGKDPNDKGLGGWRLDEFGPGASASGKE